MGAERQHKERNNRNGRNAHSTSGKVSIGNLVDEGLLVPGNIVVCNNWPFSAVITAEGTFDARWTPIPSSFVDNVGHEFMKAHFETPSAWATAVCRVMRAQTRAQKQDREEKRVKGGGGGGSGESRVAVNGWTACRVQICKGDGNWELAQRLDSDNGGTKDDKVIEVSLDMLRRELTLRASRRTRTTGSIRRMGGGPKKRKSLDTAYEMALDSRNDSGSDHNNNIDDDDEDEYDRSLAPAAVVYHSNAELQEITGAVDGLAKRVESDLALGCVKQRRAAAAAADAISAASSAGLGSQALAAYQPSSVANYALDRKRMYSSRKRKSIPDMSRHAKQSRVPTGDNSDNSNEANAEQLDAATRQQLAYFHERAETLKQTHMELKALRYQRKQQLKRRIANALDVWLHQRNALRMQQNNRLFLAANKKQSQQLQPASPVPSLATSPCSATLAAGDTSAFPLAMSLEPAANDWTLDIVGVRVPRHQLQTGIPQLCTACGSAGSSKLSACYGCGDRYHDFCIRTLSSQSFLSPKFVCPACRVCARCFTAGGSEITEDLLQCDQCGVCVHARCSAQQSVHRDGLAGIVRESGGRWKCDSCICCLECGFVMTAGDIAKHQNGESPKTSEWQQRVCWMHDFSICGQCAQQIDRGKVCPECIATYANSQVGNSSMVCCDICQFWVHANCDPALTPSVYDALITLEDEAYVCPRCCTTSYGSGMLESSQDNSDAEDDLAAIMWLPRCLRSLQEHQVKQEDENDSSEAAALPDIVTSSPLSLASSSTTTAAAAATALMFPAEPVKTKSEPETTEEAANMLLSLTQLDVRFGHDRFEVGALEQRFCRGKLLLYTGDTEDWRCCALCGLRGDGTQAQPALGRLVPLKSSTVSTKDIGQWVHVECLAWAWGPRPVVHSELSCGLSYTWTRFEGALIDSSTSGSNDGNTELPPMCTLCGRTNASFHCCAPVPCFDTAFHLPCLLLAGSPSPHLMPNREQYCAAWRRALCANHAPMFSAMMPGDATVGSQSYTHTRVQTRLDVTGLDVASCSSLETAAMCVVGGGLVVLDWGQTTSYLKPACGLRCVRIFAIGDQSYSIGIAVVQDKEAASDSSDPALLWHGWIQLGIPQDLTAKYPHSAVAHSLADLMELLFAQQHIAISNPLARLELARQQNRPLHAYDSANESGSESDNSRLGDFHIGSSVKHDLSEYREGAITHISLKNFVTYDRMEVTPGPYMNMIIGPNGTGKSTIVCAIALGLGGRPSLLGRAKDISEFVKHGHERGYIEITLASHSHGELKIRREIIREGNKTLWKLNGRSATFSQVQKSIRQLNVQVDNLCQFLPQDRVVEFSKMTPQELLKETQKAVGREDLLQMQLELAEYRLKERQTMDELQRVSQDVDSLRKQNEVLEQDVKRWQDRLEAESQLRVLTALVPVVRYTDAKAEHDRAKEARKEAHARYMSVKNSVSTGVEEEIEQLEAHIAEKERRRRQIQDELQAAERENRQRVARLETFESRQRDLTADLEEIGKRAQRRREEITRLRAELAQLEAAHPEERPEEVDSRELVQVASELNKEKLTLKNEIIELQDSQKALMRSNQQLNHDLNANHKQLRDLDNVAMRRRETLRRFNEDTVRALEWLEKNRSMFSQHVFSPACLEASISNPNMANIIDTILTASSLKMFVTQCDEDYHTFTREVNDKLKLRVDVVYYRQPLNSFKPPMSRSELQSLGFDGYASDFIEAPAPVLAALCSRDDVHQIPVAQGKVDNDRIESSQMFKEYIAEGTRFIISRGRYGSKSATVMTSRVKSKSLLLSSEGETEEVQATRDRLRKEIDEIRDRLNENEGKMKKLSMREQKVRDRHRSIESREEDLRTERQRISKEVARWERQKVQIETRRAQLASKIAEDRRSNEDGADGQSERRRIEQEQRRNVKERAQAIADIATGVSKMTDLVHRLAVAGLGGQHDIQKLNELKAEAERQREAILEAQQAFEQASVAYNESKTQAKMCLEETRRVTEDMSDEERQAVRAAQDERRDMTLEELEIELTTCRQRLSLAANSGLSARVMEQYEERKQQLAHMETSTYELEHSLRKIRKKKLALRRQWEQPLSEIISKIGEQFSHMFDQIGCMGEVSLLRAGDGVVVPEEAAVDATEEGSSSTQRPNGSMAVVRDDQNYGSWGVEIRVAFRKSEALQVLDNHRQSGGERAVSTILYLQSMQCMVAAPFRVVDEINQGMDQNNERMVHEIIVDTACRKGSSQYFLITPKLLPDLNYHPMMKVLCIFNGEWQPAALNFKKYISEARSRQSAAVH
ncbi:Structural maintenance of chromosomes protein 5 [Coemansia brasiliensis]|uniref:Structural maintenance of chromosomes protein 5 n=1 Tax=Coemansia brasiliensis TaxID=2650707 RepID=A0A9W8I912_9FUNG|nr:Structural maintenance of chromosomes protein 5 [Coemansia brasiliensis]